MKRRSRRSRRKRPQPLLERLAQADARQRIATVSESGKQTRCWHKNDAASSRSRIISVDRKNRVISLSVKAKDVADEKEAMKNLNQTQAQEAAPKTIGDLIKQQLENADK